jgi:ribosomal protein S18 acetylase RimI-like enzyme
VAPASGGVCFAHALLDAVADWARDRGCERLLLSVTQSNETARRFYDSCGFVDTGKREALREGSDMHTLILSKPL